MKRIFLWLLAISALIFMVQRITTPLETTMPHLSTGIRCCDYRLFIRSCLLEEHPYQPTRMKGRDACYPAIAYCLVKTFPMTPAGETAYVIMLFAGLIAGLTVLMKPVPIRQSAVLLPTLCFTTAIASGPLRGNPSAWAAGAVFLFLAWYKSEVRWQRNTAALALAFATSLKLTPAIFGILYLQGKVTSPRNWPWREITVSACTFAALFILPFMLFGGIGEVGCWFSNALANSGYYGSYADFGLVRLFASIYNSTAFAAIYDYVKLPMFTQNTVRMMTLACAIAFFILSTIARTRYLTLLLLGAGSAFICHHDYGLVYMIPAFLTWFTEEPDVLPSTTGPAKYLRSAEAVLWFIFLTPLGYSFTVPVMTFCAHRQNDALILLAFTAAIRCISRIRANGSI